MKMQMKVQMKSAVVLALYLLAGCAARPAPNAPPGVPELAAPAAPVEVSLHVEALSQKERRQYVLRDADTLHSKDGVALYVKVDRPAYTYVAIVNDSGPPSVLYPRGAEELMQPGVELRIPRAGEWLYLDDKVGRERLYVVGSTRPLYQNDRDLCNELRLPCAVASASKKPPPPPPPPPPGNLDTRTRGRHHKSGPIVQAQTDEGGVAVLRFSFQHEP